MDILRNDKPITKVAEEMRNVQEKSRGCDCNKLQSSPFPFSDKTLGNKELKITAHAQKGKKSHQLNGDKLTRNIDAATIDLTKVK